VSAQATVVSTTAAAKIVRDNVVPVAEGAPTLSWCACPVKLRRRRPCRGLP